MKKEYSERFNELEENLDELEDALSQIHRTPRKAKVVATILRNLVCIGGRGHTPLLIDLYKKFGFSEKIPFKGGMYSVEGYMEIPIIKTESDGSETKSLSIRDIIKSVDEKDGLSH